MPTKKPRSGGRDKSADQLKTLATGENCAPRCEAFAEQVAAGEHAKALAAFSKLVRLTGGRLPAEGGKLAEAYRVAAVHGKGDPAATGAELVAWLQSELPKHLDGGTNARSTSTGNSAGTGRATRSRSGGSSDS